MMHARMLRPIVALVALAAMTTVAVTTPRIAAAADAHEPAVAKTPGAKPAHGDATGKQHAAKKPATTTGASGATITKPGLHEPPTGSARDSGPGSGAGL